MMSLDDKYAVQALYNDGENFVLLKKDVAFWLTYGALQCYEADNDNEGLESRLSDNFYILREIEGLDDDELIGLSYHPMSDWYFVNFELVDEWESGEI